MGSSQPPGLTLAAGDARYQKQTSYAGTTKTIAMSAVPSAVLAGTAKTALVSIPIPAGAMGPNADLEIYYRWQCTNDASGSDVFHVSASFGGQDVGLGDNRAILGSSSGRFHITNTGVTNAQICDNGNAADGSTGTGTFTSTTVDTTQLQQLVIFGQAPTTGDNMQLMSYKVVVTNP